MFVMAVPKLNIITRFLPLECCPQPCQFLILIFCTVGGGFLYAATKINQLSLVLGVDTNKFNY